MAPYWHTRAEEVTCKDDTKRPNLDYEQTKNKVLHGELLLGLHRDTDINYTGNLLQKIAININIYDGYDYTRD